MTIPATKKPEPAQEPEEKLNTAIPVAADSAPFTPKVHRPKHALENAPRAVAKGSFLAKQEFFERKVNFR